MTREEALNKTIGVLTYHQANFCKSKEAVANMNEIIEALEKIDQERVADKDINVPTTDCISREAVMHILDEVGDDFDSPREAVVPIDYIADMVSELPSVTPMPKWIPCSERLPEESGQYLITVKYKHVDNYEDIYAEHGEWDGSKWDMFMFGHCGEVESILAWMPLPLPYKQEVEE